MKPLNDFLYLRKCYVDDIRNEDGSVLIHRTDRGTDLTNFAEILDVGPRCKYFKKKHIGNKVLCPEFDNGMHGIKNDEWLIKEDAILNAVFE